MNIGRLLATCFLVVAISPVAVPAMGQTPPAKTNTLILLFSAQPASELAGVSISIGGIKTKLTDVTPADIALELVLKEPEYSWIVANWHNGNGFSALPVAVSPGMQDIRSDIAVIKDSSPPPTDKQIVKLCVGGSITSMQHAFETYFTCKSAASRITSKGKAWRAALQGWLSANLYLINAVRPFSPFSYDADLVAKLKDAIDTVADGTSPDDWVPLRIADAQAFVDGAAAADMRLYRLIAPLIKRGDYDAADTLWKYVDLRYNAVLGPTGTASIDGINRAELDKTRAYIDTLIKEKRIAAP